MLNPFTLVEDDLLPSLVAFLRNADGSPMDLTSTNVKFCMSTQDLSDVRIDHAPCTVVDAVNGKVQYDWVEPNTATPGTFAAQFKVIVTTLAGDKVMTVPTEEPLLIVIVPRQA